MTKAKRIQMRNSTAEFLVFTTQAGEQGIEVRVEDETVWLTQKLIATLFEIDVRTVSEHLQNIFSSDELAQESVIRKFRNTASDGKQYLTAFYRLEAIIAVGFRVNSTRATQFRQWAIGILRDFKCRRLRRATRPLAPAQEPLPALPVAGRKSRIRRHANCALYAARRQNPDLCRTRRAPPGPRRDLRA